MKNIKNVIFCFLFIFTSCARANRYRADFYGTATIQHLKDASGSDELGAIFMVNRTERIHVIGRDNKYLPLSNYTAVLVTSRGKLLSPETVPTNVPICINGILDNGAARSKNGAVLLQSGTTINDFHPSLQVKKIK